jgi:hypothetical protein
MTTLVGAVVVDTVCDHVADAELDVYGPTATQLESMGAPDKRRRGASAVSNKKAMKHRSEDPGTIRSLRSAGPSRATIEESNVQARLTRASAR